MCVGPVEDELDHLCSNRSCVNGDHLEDAPHEVNVRRGRGGENWAAKTHCPQGHPYDEENTNLYQGRRYCRKCGTERGRKWRLANPEKHRQVVRDSRARRNEKG